MYLGVFNLLRMIWPYLKESIFGHATFHVWLRRNVTTVLWFFLMMTMLIVVIYLAGTARSLYRENGELRHQVDGLTTDRKILGDELQRSRDLVKGLTDTLRCLSLRDSSKPCSGGSPPPAPVPEAPRPSPTDHNSKLIDRLNRWDQSPPRS